MRAVARKRRETEAAQLAAPQAYARRSSPGVNLLRSITDEKGLWSRLVAAARRGR